jgi:hypothetical protein
MSKKPRKNSYGSDYLPETSNLVDQLQYFDDRELVELPSHKPYFYVPQNALQSPIPCLLHQPMGCDHRLVYNRRQHWNASCGNEKSTTANDILRRQTDRINKCQKKLYNRDVIKVYQAELFSHRLSRQ